MKTKYTSVEHYFSDLPEEVLDVVLFIDKCIKQTIPDAIRVLKHNLPFYGNENGIVCYINPRKQRIEVGFVKGAALPDLEGILQGNGKYVRHFYVPYTEDIDLETLKVILLIAAEYNTKRKKIKPSPH